MVDCWNACTKVIVGPNQAPFLVSVSQQSGKAEPLSENGARVKIMILTKNGCLVGWYEASESALLFRAIVRE
jgi:hypothetical protein